MSKLLPMVSIFALLGLSVAQAQPAFVKALGVPTTRSVLHGRDVPWVQVYEWEADGVRHNAWPGDGIVPPAGAAKMQLQLFTFPTGQLRHLRFVKGDTTPTHVNLSDIMIYSVSGVQTETVNGISDTGAPGDVSMHPYGVRHFSVAHTDAERDEFAFKPRPGAGDQAVFLHQRALPLQLLGTQMHDGKLALLAGDAARALPLSDRFQARIFTFPTMQLAHLHYRDGYGLPRHTNVGEKLAFVLSGRYRVTIGDTADTVVAGDMFRMIDGQAFALQAVQAGDMLVVDGGAAP